MEDEEEDDVEDEEMDENGERNLSQSFLGGFWDAGIDQYSSIEWKNSQYLGIERLSLLYSGTP